MRSRRNFLKTAATGLAWSGLLWLPKAQQVSAFPRRKIPTATASCSYKETLGASTASKDIGRYSFLHYLAWQFTTAGYTLCQVDHYILRVDAGGTAVDLQSQIWSDSGSDTPGSALATSTNTIHSADVGTSLQWVTFNYAGQALTASTKYWLIIKATSNNTTNYYQARYGTYSATKYFYVSDTGASWSLEGNNPAYAKLYNS